ncbi:MAG: hypothetical protein RI572_00680 [Salegentibacter sp.]|uniref:Secreted protein n=1 Tax=Salegentibacter flavus TaxID=287099 RepID=A0A1I5AVT9_9FLAO|nr:MULTISPECIES: hypothetical protein [Salegentibacter]MDR9455897.1 hypothetical protein [Salegentibacter sp.]SFN66564.1 hypothetical protein SAMN05660413_02050 [Salegentibacter flavus]
MKNSATKILLSILVVSFGLFTACKDEEKTTETSRETPSVNSTTQESSASSSEAPELNPKHGEPFHRCDIPVGAPLDQAASTQQNTSTQSPVRLKSSTPKINPPHGEPGHSCSIPVGAPLEG